MKLRKLAATSLALLAIGTVPAATQTYPAKPVKIIVTWNAGGTTDIVSRLFSPELAKELGQPVPVVNRVGGGGSLGTKEALAEKDGYTILMTTSGNHILTPLVNDVGYTYDDFIPIGQLSTRSMVLAVLAKSPWKNLADLQKAAKANPGKYTFGAVPNGTPFLVTSAWADAAGVKLLHVPQTGGAPGVTGVLGGHLDMVPESLSSVQTHLKAETMRGLAVFSKERDKNAPDIPTAAEQGYKVFGNPFTGVAVAKGTPPEIVEKLRQATARIAKDAGFIERMAKAGEDVQYLNGPDFGEVWERDWKVYKPILDKNKKK